MKSSPDGPANAYHRSMDRGERITQLKGQMRDVFDELHRLVAQGAPDADKERLADTFNGLMDRLDALARSDA